MNELDCLVYVSRSTLDDDALPAALADIVKVASYLNREAGITGILTYHSGQFVQLLEGPPAAIDRLMIHLHFDERHQDICIVARGRIQAKEALSWAMIAPEQDHPLRKSLGELLSAPPQTIQPWRQLLLQMMLEPSA